MSAAPRNRRRHRCHWTAEEDLYLVREWGEISTRLMRQRLGRTALAILTRAQVLGLPAPTHCSGAGEPMARAAERLGVDVVTVNRFARDCGVRCDRLARVSIREVVRSVRRGCDVDQLEALFAQRIKRVVTIRAWCGAHPDTNTTTVGRRLSAAGVRTKGQRYRMLLPEQLLDEVMRHSKRGRWVTLWRAIQALDRLPCEPWLLALAAVDIAAAGRAPEGPAGDAARAAAEWTEHLPQGPLHLATRLAVEAVIP